MEKPKDSVEVVGGREGTAADEEVVPNVVAAVPSGGLTATGPDHVRNVKSTGKKKRSAPAKAAALAAAAAVKHARNIKSKVKKKKSALAKGAALFAAASAAVEVAGGPGTSDAPAAAAPIAAVASGAVGSRLGAACAAELSAVAVPAACGASVVPVARSGASAPGAFARPRGRRCCDGVVAAACRAVPGYRGHEHLEEFLLDSAAGGAIATSLVAAQWGAPELEAIEVSRSSTPTRARSRPWGASLISLGFVTRRGRVFVS